MKFVLFHSNGHKPIKGGTLLLMIGVSFVLFGGWFFAGISQSEKTVAADSCIRCHVSIYNEGLNSAEVHAPFWERQCDLCHLAAGSTWSGNISETEQDRITGTVVSQELLWRKPLKFSSLPDETSDHLIGLNGLDIDTAYRIRLQFSPVQSALGVKAPEGQWLGLRPSELPANETVALNLDKLLPPGQASMIRGASLYRDNNTVFVACQINQPMNVQVEVQKLDGLNFGTDESNLDASPSDSTQDGHPPMKSAEDLAIKVCYQCHSEADLGTSHPVRLYGGRDVRIPDELPTVDGMLTCVTCHAPHGAEGKMLVREVIKTKLCVTCHYKFKNRSPSTMFR